MRVAISNQKGGAGKTTTAINLAGGLAARGHSVLGIDVDPQGHFTEGVGFDELYDADIDSMYNVMTDISNSELINDVIVEGAEFDVIPSHVDMFKLEGELTTARRREERLGMALDALETEYDFVIIDCPPNLGPITDNAILAARNLVIPAPTRSTAIRAMEILFDQIEVLSETYEVTISQLAVVANEVTTDSEADEMLDWFGDVFGDAVPVYEIRKRVALQRAWNNGVSIFEHEEECDMEAVYDDLAAHIEEVAE